MLGYRPYLGRGRKEIKQLIISKQAKLKSDDIPEDWSNESMDFINQLLQRKPKKRLGFNGVGEIKNHPWMKNIDWESLSKKLIDAPFVPPTTKENFDKRYCEGQDNVGEETIERYELYLQSDLYGGVFVNYTFVNMDFISKFDKKQKLRVTSSRSSKSKMVLYNNDGNKNTFNKNNNTIKTKKSNKTIITKKNSNNNDLLKENNKEIKGQNNRNSNPISVRKSNNNISQKNSNINIYNQLSKNNKSSNIINNNENNSHNAIININVNNGENRSNYNTIEQSMKKKKEYDKYSVDNLEKYHTPMVNENIMCNNYINVNFNNCPNFDNNQTNKKNEKLLDVSTIKKILSNHIEGNNNKNDNNANAISNNLSNAENNNNQSDNNTIEVARKRERISVNKSLHNKYTLSKSSSMKLMSGYHNNYFKEAKSPTSIKSNNEKEDAINADQINSKKKGKTNININISNSKKIIYKNSYNKKHYKTNATNYLNKYQTIDTNNHGLSRGKSEFNLKIDTNDVTILSKYHQRHKNRIAERTFNKTASCDRIIMNNNYNNYIKSKNSKNILSNINSKKAVQKERIKNTIDFDKKLMFWIHKSFKNNKQKKNQYNNDNTNNINVIIPEKIKNKFEKKIENDYKYKDDFFNEIIYYENNTEKEKKKEKEKEKIKSIKYPNYESLIKGFQDNQLQNYSIKTDQADTDLLDLFDRSQKTNAATKAKDVNFDYCSTNQRIASFMDFSQHLKLEYILKIGKDIYRNKRNLLEYQSKHNIQKPTYGELLVNKCPHFRDSNSLFHGFMPFEEEGQYLIDNYNKINNIYEPLDYMRKYGFYYLLEDTEKYNSFINAVYTSIKNYNKYIVSDKFSINDIKKFNKNNLKKFLSRKIDQNLIFNQNYIISEIILEIEELYSNTIKEIIMNYILRSPFERQRLNIKYYPRKILPSSYTIAQYGSFNRNKYTNWVENYNNSFNFLKNNLSLCNISLSGLINWTNSFSHINLIYLKNLHYLKNSINTIHLDEFWRIQESYLNKVFHFMRDIYYRGAILITKKNKALKRKDIISEGKWTFKGFIPNDEENSAEYNDENYGMYYEDQLQDFWTNINLENLIDIRLTPSNIGYVAYFLKKQIDLSESDYDHMTQDDKIKLNNCISTYCLLFFRKLTEKALNDYFNFFEQYKSNLKILEELNEKISYTNDLIYESEEDIHLPEIISFFISPYINPLISIKTRMNDHGEVKIEYDLDQVNEKISKIIESICTIFSSLPTTHFLEN
jgi:hypothetical protein